jgi:GTP cyclohydrolase I
LRYPITVLDRDGIEQHTVGRVALAVDGPQDLGRAHRSRFLEVLADHRGEITPGAIPTLLRDLRGLFQAERARVEVEFPYFLARVAPVTGARSVMDCAARILGESGGTEVDLLLAIEVPVTSLCPCSKAISRAGAHTQRGRIGIEARMVPRPDGMPEALWLDDLAEVAEGAASAPIYPLVKRADQRHLTMRAYDRPAFVEDMVRDVALGLMADPRIAWFRVKVENHESIHNHNAFAQVTWSRRGDARVAAAR